MDLMQAIYQRRAVRHFTDAPVPAAMVSDLIRAAIQAPSALNQQPWSFAVVRSRQRLDDYSERAKVYMLATLPRSLSLHERADLLASDDYHAFHHAGTLVAICARPAQHAAAEDCCLAAQNFMLAAHGLGLGTCPIGFVRTWLNLPRVKLELGIPNHHLVVMPMVVGWPAGPAPATPREEPDIVCWHDDPAPIQSAATSGEIPPAPRPMVAQ